MKSLQDLVALLDSAELVAFVSTSDQGRARDFYAATLGLRLVEETPFALVFDADGTMLRVTTVDRVLVAPYTVLGWGVADIDTAVDAMVERGIEFDRHDGMGMDARGIWTSPSGARVAWFKDLDGNTLSLTQF